MSEWRTFSIRVNPKSRKAVAVQARFPLTGEELQRLINWLDEHRYELINGHPWPGDNGAESVSARVVEQLAVKP